VKKKSFICFVGILQTWRRRIGGSLSIEMGIRGVKLPYIHV
jgi:hypothetical protein